MSDERLRLLPFAALAAVAGAQWAALLAEPPLGRALAVAALACAAAAALLAVGRAALRPALTSAAGAAAVLAALALGLLAIGVPAELLTPSRWGELLDGLGKGFTDLSDNGVPYSGESDWARVAMLVGLPLALAAAAVLAFWPRRGRLRRGTTLALLVLLGAFGYAASMNEKGGALLFGLALTVAICAWLWLPGMRWGRVAGAAAMVAAAAVLALPVAARLDAEKPLVDYLSWNYPGEQKEVDYSWNHTYGPLEWPRTGEVMFEAASDSPEYWRMLTLDLFDGVRWQRSGSPPEAETAPGDEPNPDWILSSEVTIRALNGGLAPSAGRAEGIEDFAAHVSSSGDDGLILTDTPLRSGQTYTLSSYAPEPAVSELRRAPAAYPGVLAPYTRVGLPDGPRVEVPPRGQPPQPAAARRLAASPYGDVYRLARRITAGETTVYGAAHAIETELRSSYGYFEAPPNHALPLRAFLFEDRSGYCQQFSGAMALMLRMLGIPARIAAGFAPGEVEKPGTFVIRDYDAHSWVEAYFMGIGWVTFDPTPAAAPTSGPRFGAGNDAAAGPGVVRAPFKDRAVGASDSSGRPTVLILVAVIVLLAAAAGAALGLRRRRFGALPPPAATDAQARELRLALPRLGLDVPPGATLLELERRVGADLRPATASYLARLRAARFAPGRPSPPTLAQRRALRRELGTRSRLGALLALPPGGPTAGAG